MDEGNVTYREFTTAVASLERQIASGFRGLHIRLDTADSVQDNHGERIARVEERTKNASRSANKSSAGVSAVVSAAITAALAYFGVSR